MKPKTKFPSVDVSFGEKDGSEGETKHLVREKTTRRYF